MQQHPNDAFAIADLLWRIRPDLIIELGTSGGGSAHFFAHVMRQYDATARPLVAWCDHDAVTFHRLAPVSAAALRAATAAAAAARRVIVIDDADHTYATTEENLRAYAPFVTPGSYFIVQDTRGGQWPTMQAAQDFLRSPAGKDFEQDRRWEYLIFSQHSGDGWV
eukprot:gene27641-9556_t